MLRKVETIREFMYREMDENPIKGDDVVKMFIESDIYDVGVLKEVLYKSDINMEDMRKIYASNFYVGTIRYMVAKRIEIACKKNKALRIMLNETFLQIVDRETAREDMVWKLVNSGCPNDFDKIVYGIFRKEYGMEIGEIEREFLDIKYVWKDLSFINKMMNKFYDMFSISCDKMVSEKNN